MSADGSAGMGSGLSVELVDWIETPTAGVWSATWQISNRTGEAVELLEAWLPHDQFRRERDVFEPTLTIEAGRGTLLLTGDVSCEVAPGETVENAFMILRARWRELAWRVFVRLRVEHDGQGRPAPFVEVLTVQPVGVSRPA